MKQTLTYAILLVMTAFCSTPCPAHDGNDRTVVGAYNIYTDFKGDGWAKRRAAVDGFLQKGHFDIVTLQEVTEAQLPDIIFDMKNYGYVVGARSDGHRATQGWYEFTPIFYRKSRYELLDWSSFWVSETPDIPGSILPKTKKHARVLTWAKLKDKQTSKILLVASVHIHGLRARDEISIILAKLHSFHQNEPVLLLGDYNMEPKNSGYRYMVGPGSHRGFVDVMKAAQKRYGPNTTVIGPNGMTYDNVNRMHKVDGVKRIDYMFTCGVGEIVSYRNIPNLISAPDIFASDHHAIAAEIEGFQSCHFKP